jgi:hypothetical protein
MKETNDFIGNYRILTKLPSDVAGELYLVEHPSRADATSFLLLWLGVELSRDEDRATFLQKSTSGTLNQNSSHIPILDAGIENQHPYITVAHSTQTQEILREHLRSLEPTLQAASESHPNDPHARTEAFLRLFTSMNVLPAQTEDPGAADAPTVPLPPPEPIPSHPPAVAANVNESAAASPPLVAPTRRQRVVAGYQRLKLWQRVVLALLALALVGWGFFALYTHVPALGATVTITPIQRTLNADYQISVGTGSPSANVIQGRKISLTSEQKSQTVAATGKGHHDATAATGNLVVAQIHLNSGGSTTVGESILTSASGVEITTTGTVTVSDGGTVTQPARAVKPGSGGNIGPNDINFPIVITSVTTNLQVGTAYAANPNSFSGGTDASDFSYVQQSDIDTVVGNFSKQVTQDTSVKVARQVKSDETQASDVQCTPKSSSNHNANDQSNDVTITFSTTCAVLVYKYQDLQQAAMAAYRADGPARFGEGYDLVGNMQIGSPTLSNPTVDSAQFSVPIKGIWIFQWTPPRQRELLNMIAGKPQDETAQIISGREGVKDVDISGNWFPGSALPTNPNDIKFAVTKVNGL